MQEADAAGSLCSSRATQRLWIAGPCTAARCAEVVIRGMVVEEGEGLASVLFLVRIGEALLLLIGREFNISRISQFFPVFFKSMKFL
ncbi:hypothetical protein Taro_025341 [Colocasia esculenta]|uniref:Uncharacterized protein n=1 Tax=Colocasia esculenta TaxID=4460 RepID=A0A843VK89_COLES|nr:hypothetical protein [Colocasia esculenta]